MLSYLLVTVNFHFKAGFALPNITQDATIQLILAVISAANKIGFIKDFCSCQWYIYGQSRQH